METFEIFWRPEALRDVSDHIVFLDKVSHDAAIELRNALYEGACSLKEFPERNSTLEMPENLPFVVRKKIVSKRYLILYVIDGNKVEIYRVLDSRKRFEHLV